MEHWFAIIKVGGDLTAEQLREIVRLARQDNAENIEIPEEVAQYLSDEEKGHPSIIVTPRVQHIEASGAEVNYGEFARLEAWLKERRIPFDRYTEGGVAEDSTSVSYRPDAGVQEFRSTASGEPFVTASEWRILKQSYPSGDELFKELARVRGSSKPVAGSPGHRLTAAPRTASPWNAVRGAFLIVEAIPPMPVSMSFLGQVIQRLEAQAEKYRRMAEHSADGKTEAYNEGVVEGIEEAIEVVRNAMNYAHYHQRLVDDQRLREVLNALKERYQQALVASDDDAERAFYRGKLAGIQIALESL